MSKFGIKKDCFVINKAGTTYSCSCLNDLYCEKEKCKFYKKDRNDKYDWQKERLNAEKVFGYKNKRQT